MGGSKGGNQGGGAAARPLPALNLSKGPPLAGPLFQATPANSVTRSHRGNSGGALLAEPLAAAVLFSRTADANGVGDTTNMKRRRRMSPPVSC